MILAVLGLALVMARYFEPTAGFMDEYVSLTGLPQDVRNHLDAVLLVPLGSVVVVFVRVALGLRMLGPFRPILIAIALQQTGVVLGILFLVLVLTVVVALRPRLQGRGLPYFARLSVLLAAVVTVELVVLIVASASQSAMLVRAAFFPIIVLCLTADGFARVLEGNGLHPALWRGGTTVALAVIVTGIVEIPTVASLLREHPEMVLIEIASIFVIGTRMKWGLLDHWNPGEAQ